MASPRGQRRPRIDRRAEQKASRPAAPDGSQLGRDWFPPDAWKSIILKRFNMESVIEKIRAAKLKTLIRVK
jgi:hypothetical protein